MTALWPLAAVLPLVAAWCWLRRLGIGNPAERAALAAGAGLAASSITFFVARWAGVDPALYLKIETVALLAAITAGFRRSPRRVEPARGVVDARRPGYRRVTVPLFAATLAAAAAILWHHVRAHPGGSWDAVAIWNVRAAFLASPGDVWRQAFGTVSLASHPDYPLLLPGAVAHAWTLAGANDWWIAATIAVTFTAATALLLAGSLARLRGEAFALAGLGLLLTPEFLLQGSTQNADVPLAFFSLAAIVLLADQTPSSGRLILAGAACGAAAWTKNEGLVVALAVPAALILIVASRRGGQAAWDTASDLAIGLGPIVVLLVLFKLLLSPPNDLIDGMLRPGVVNYWLDTVRVWFVAREMLMGFVGWGAWRGPIVPLALLAIVAAIPRERATAAGGGARTAAALVGVQVTAFFCIYVMTPQSVAWHLQTSWPRLVTQLWPTLVWWACVNPGLPRRVRGVAA